MAHITQQGQPGRAVGWNQPHQLGCGWVDRHGAESLELADGTDTLLAWVILLRNGALICRDDMAAQAGLPASRFEIKHKIGCDKSKKMYNMMYIEGRWSNKPMMVRKQIYIEQEQERLLKRLSEELRKPEAEIIRQAIDAQTRSTYLIQRDLKAWEEERKFIQGLIAAGPVPGQRTWTRESLYER